MKHKKITIKPFINKNLAPLENTTKFPLYFQITFERRNTQVKSHFNSFIDNLDGLKGEEMDLLNFEIDILKRTVGFEYAKVGNSFTLHGIKEKYDLYILDLSFVFESYLKKKLLKAIKYCNSEFLPIIKFEGFEVTFSLLYKASKLLIPNFLKSIPSDFKDEIEAYQQFSIFSKNKLSQSLFECIFDWKEEKIQKELETYLTENVSLKPVIAKKTISLLDHIIEDRLKFA